MTATKKWSRTIRMYYLDQLQSEKCREQGEPGERQRERGGSTGVIVFSKSRIILLERTRRLFKNFENATKIF
jgi:hypothetical protein